MVYLLWALLNIALFVFFLRICFKATRLISEKFGLFAVIIFVFGLISFGCSNNGQQDENKAWNLVSDSTNRTTQLLKDVVLDDNLIATTHLQIGGIKSTNTPVNASTQVYGLICGTNWKTLAVRVEKISNNKLEYSVDGIVEWRLFGLRIYSQFKNYDGFAFTKL